MPRGLIHGLEPERIRANLERVRAEAGSTVEILAASKYVPVEEMGALAEAGVGLVGENRLQDLEAKHELMPDAFTWDFIGNVQSRKVRSILPLVRLIHSIASDSALEQLGRHAAPETEILVEVNVSGEKGKGGVEPADLGEFIDRCPVRVGGLMTMPPFTQDPEGSRRARGRARPRAALDGHQPGLASGRARGGVDHPAGDRPLHLGPAVAKGRSRRYSRPVRGCL